MRERPVKFITHIDKGHIHNHIIFCAADNIKHNKYHDCKQSYYHIRKLSDELCKAHNLSIIIPGGERGKKYKERQSDQNGSTWKTQLRRDINFCIKSASTYEDFLLLMKAKGYEIKGESFEEVLPNTSLSILWIKNVLSVAIRNRLVRNTQRNVSGNASK